MEILIELPETEVNSPTTASLRDWLKKSSIDGVGQVKQLAKPHDEDELGVDWLSIVQVGIDNIPTILSVVSAIIAWREAHRSKITVEIPLPNGTKIRIESRKSSEEILKEAEKLIDGLDDGEE